MKLFSIVLALVLCSSLAAAQVNDFVTDKAGIIDPAYTQQISARLQGLLERDVMQGAIYMVPSLGNKSIEDLAIELAHGTLGTKEKDNGLLILIALEEKQWRIEVGYGLEGVLNDAKVGRLGRTYLVPAFRAGAYGKGILDLINAIEYELTGDVAGMESYTPQPAASKLNIPSLVFTILVWLLIFWGWRRMAKRRTKGIAGDEMSGLIMAAWLFSGRGRGGFGGGGLGGGFGGGGFGGGGASGGW